MDEIINALMNEITKRVIAKIGDDTSNMREFLKFRVKAEDIEGLEELIDNKVDGIKDDCEQIAKDATSEYLDGCEVEVEATINHR